MQARVTPAVDNLLVESGLSDTLRRYLISCQVDGKSKATIAVYSDVISGFIKFAYANNLPLEPAKVTTDNIRLFLPEAKVRGQSDCKPSEYEGTDRQNDEKGNHNSLS